MISFCIKNKYLVGILVLTFLALYGKTVKFDYVIDDKTFISMNEFTAKGFNGLTDIFMTSSWEGYVKEKGDSYRPLTLSTFAITKQIF